MTRLMVVLFLTMSLPLLSGCTLGPRVERKVVLVNKYDNSGRPVKIGTVDKNVKLPIRFETDGGDEFSQELDVGGWQVSPPVFVPINSIVKNPVEAGK